MYVYIHRADASGQAVFGQTVNPISTRGADHTHHSTKSPPRIFRPCDGPDTYILTHLIKVFDLNHCLCTYTTFQWAAVFDNFSCLKYFDIVESYVCSNDDKYHIQLDVVMIRAGKKFSVDFK